MYSKLIGLFVLIALCSAQKVPVNIYYETLCPDSQAFITRQIYPEMKHGLADHIQITWVPFGKSTFQTQGSDVMFECHHGPNECYGNKVHSCALQHIQVNSYQNDHTRESLIMEFINCLMKAGKNFPDNIYPGESCARETRVNNWDTIAQCANSTDGSNLLKKNGEMTMAFQSPLKSVPTITFNHQFDTETQTTALMNFRAAACKFITFPKPSICAQSGAPESVIIAPLVLAVAYTISRIF